MKAVILAGGKGKRMGALTQEAPKPMLLVQGKPVLEHIITGLRDSAKIREFFIITGHCAEMIENHFKDGAAWNVSCVYGCQPTPDGTGKAPELAASWVGKEPFLLTYGDVLVDSLDYAEMLRQFHADALISVKAGENVRLGGAVIFDENFYLKDLIEKGATGNAASPWYNTGIYIFPPRLFDYTQRLEKSPRGEYELTDAIRAMARDGLRIQGYEIKRRWADVRDPAELERLNRQAAAGW
ncbi:MAG: nucleotidyltransferase family protein [bacterium]